MRKLLFRASTWACVLLVAGCASYQPLPLPERAKLAGHVTDIQRVLPAPASGGASTVIDVDKPLTPEEVGLLAILNAPELQSERGEFDLAQARIVQSALLPNPSVSLGYAAVLGGPATAAAYIASLAQDIASLVTYRSREAAAKAHVAQVNAGLLWKEWQVAQKARLLAVGLYWNGRALRANQAQLALIAHTAAQVQYAVDRGDASLANLTPLLASKASLEQSVATLELRQAKDWGDLNGLLGLKPDARFVIASPSVAAPPPDLRTLIASTANRRPDLVALQLGYQSADESVRTAILGQFPAFALGGSWGSDTTQVRSAGPTVTFDLPIFKRNQGGIAQARATRLLLHEQYQSRLDTTESTILALHSRSQYLASHVEVAQNEVQVAEAQAKAARAAFRAGNLDERSLNDYESTALARRLAIFDFSRGLDEARIGLQLELGLGLPQTRIAPLDTSE
ncbi:MAG: TolC family protein [Burkholderiaceae bacterium]|nr:MAG: TolC family protein [Burkholderiaceae bacterium]TAM08060.1 MAG: TolC family protein [Pusillimonas sp.]